LVVKSTKSWTRVDVNTVGYLHQTTQTCTKITSLPINSVPVTKTAEYLPFSEFDVNTFTETFVATDIDENATLLADYQAGQAAADTTTTSAATTTTP